MLFYTRITALTQTHNLLKGGTILLATAIISYIFNTFSNLQLASMLICCLLSFS